jgi:hypothetical protein
MVPLVALAALLGGRGGKLHGLIQMPHVYTPSLRLKGSYEFRASSSDCGITLNQEKLVAPKESEVVRYENNLKRRHERNQKIMQGYINATQFMFDRIEPTWPTVSNINNIEWRSRIGGIKMPSLAYTLDPTPSQVTSRYYENALKIVLDRMHITPERLAAAMSNNYNDLELCGSVLAQMLCLFVVHGIYRRDQVYAPVRFKDEDTGEIRIRFEDEPTEDFGDCDVDQGVSSLFLFSRFYFLSDLQER